MSLSAQSLAEVRFAGRPAASFQVKTEARRLPGEYSPPEHEILSDAERHFVSAVFSQSGLAVSDYRARPLRRRIAAALRTARASQVSDCLQLVENDPSCADRVLTALLIGYTVPFRDAPIYERLRNEILPRLTRQRDGLRVWSAACSSGAELYSVALLLAELGHLDSSFLRGTDTRPAAIAEARKHGPDFWNSIPEVFGDLKDTVGRSAFLGQTGRIAWEVENVFDFAGEGNFDLIFCRNLAIYLQAPAAGRLWEIMASALTPGGILVTGKAERPFPGRQWRRIEPCIYEVNSC